MSIKYQTVITCERCGSEVVYEGRDLDSLSVRGDWVWQWLPTLASSRYFRGQGELPEPICRACLTDDEQAQVVANDRAEAQADVEIHF